MTDTVFYSRAIKVLQPDAEFTIVDGDLSAIQWDQVVEPVPTAAEITSLAAQLEVEQLAAEEAKAAAKASAIAKLAAFGLTEEEAAALVGQ